MGILSDARLSLWDAIDNWPALAEKRITKFKLDGKIGTVSVTPTGVGDIPAITITPADIRAGWDLNRMMRFGYSLEVAYYGHFLSDVEDKIEEIWKALYRCCPDGSTATYVHTATGFPPDQIGIKIELVAIGKDARTPAVRATMAVGLRPQQDPYGT